MTAQAQEDDDYEKNERMMALGKAKAAILTRFTIALSEHFDNVQIFANSFVEGGTMNWEDGAGNTFARQAQCRESLLQLDEAARQQARNED